MTKLSEQIKPPMWHSVDNMNFPAGCLIAKSLVEKMTNCKSEIKMYNSSVVIKVKNYRFCPNIGQSHKNNNVYFVYNSYNETVHQKCHDSDCKNYVGEKINIY